MAFDFKFKDKHDHLLVTTHGNPEGTDEMFQYVDAIFRTAKDRGYTCIIVDERNASMKFGDLDSAFKRKIPSLELFPVHGVSVALISAHHSLQLYKFFEGMFRNKTFHFKAFDDMNIGREWLREACSEASTKLDKAYSYDVVEKKDYIIIDLSGDITNVNNSLMLAGDVIREATSRNTTCVLLHEEDANFDLDASEAFKIAQVLGDYIPLLGMRIASVPNDENMELEQFFETVFQNRSINYRVFKSVNEAEDWLMTKECKTKQAE